MPSSPISAGANTMSASPEKISRSALTMSTWKVVLIVYALQRLGFLDGFLDGADHVEGLFRQVVVLAGHDALEAADGVLQGHVLAGRAGEHFGHRERLGQEALDLARTLHRLLVLF